MLSIPPDLARLYDTLLAQKGVAAKSRPHYKKWLRYYLDFCHRYGFEPTDRRSFPAFNDKLRTKNQSGSLRQQAYHAVSLYYEMASPGGEGQRNLADASVPTDVEDTAVHDSAFDDSPPTLQTNKGAKTSPSTPASFLSRPDEGQEVTGYGYGHRDNSVRSGMKVSEEGKGDDAGLKLTGTSWVAVYEGLNSAIKVSINMPPESWRGSGFFQLRR